MVPPKTKHFSGISCGSRMAVHIRAYLQIYDKKTRSQYHYAVRQAKINSDILKSNSIAKTFAENDPSKFWQDIH